MMNALLMSSLNCFSLLHWLFCIAVSIQSLNVSCISFKAVFVSWVEVEQLLHYKVHPKKNETTQHQKLCKKCMYPCFYQKLSCIKIVNCVMFSVHWVLRIEIDCQHLNPWTVWCQLELYIISMHSNSFWCGVCSYGTNAVSD